MPSKWGRKFRITLGTKHFLENVVQSFTIVIEVNQKLWNDFLLHFTTVRHTNSSNSLKYGLAYLLLQRYAIRCLNIACRFQTRPCDFWYFFPLFGEFYWWREVKIKSSLEKVKWLRVSNTKLWIDVFYINLQFHCFTLLQFSKLCIKIE